MTESEHLSLRARTHYSDVTVFSSDSEETTWEKKETTCWCRTQNFPGPETTLVGPPLQNISGSVSTRVRIPPGNKRTLLSLNLSGKPRPLPRSRWRTVQKKRVRARGPEGGSVPGVHVDPPPDLRAFRISPRQAGLLEPIQTLDFLRTFWLGLPSLHLLMIQGWREVSPVQVRVSGSRGTQRNRCVGVYRYGEGGGGGGCCNFRTCFIVTYSVLM